MWLHDFKKFPGNFSQEKIYSGMKYSHRIWPACTFLALLGEDSAELSSISASDVITIRLSDFD